MKDTDKFLVIMATMSVLFDIFEKREVDLTDFDEAISMIGYNPENFKQLHPYSMVYLLAEKLTDIKLTKELIEGITNDE